MHLRTKNLTAGVWSPLCLTLGFPYHHAQPPFQFLKVAGFIYAVYSALNFSYPSLATKYTPHALFPVDSTYTALTEHSLCQPWWGPYPVLAYFLCFTFIALTTVVIYLCIHLSVSSDSSQVCPDRLCVQFAYFLAVLGM